MKEASDRKEELVRIAYEQIAAAGFEGFRIRQVAAVANIDNGTLHYHFPTKNALIQAVVKRLLNDLRRDRARKQEEKSPTALDELQREFEDVRLRIRESPEQFIVLTEIYVHARRNPEIAEMLRVLGNGWRAHLLSVLQRGIAQGVFRADLDPAAAAAAIMAQLTGIGYQVQFVGGADLDTLISQAAAQAEYFVVQQNAKPRRRKTLRPRAAT